MSAGAPLSICFARADEAAYDAVIVLPLSAVHCLPMVSSAVLRLAAANTTTASDLASAAAGAAGCSARTEETPTATVRKAVRNKRERLWIMTAGPGCLAAEYC